MDHTKLTLKEQGFCIYHDSTLGRRNAYENMVLDQTKSGEDLSCYGHGAGACYWMITSYLAIGICALYTDGIVIMWVLIP